MSAGSSVRTMRMQFIAGDFRFVIGVRNTE
jgi:hypothetical protein